MKVVQHNTVCLETLITSSRRVNIGKCASLSRCSVDFKAKDINKISTIKAANRSNLSTLSKAFSHSAHACQKYAFTICKSQSCSDYDIGPFNAKASRTNLALNGLKNGIYKLFMGPIDVLHSGGIKNELILLAIPAVAAQALDPLAQLMETAYIGGLGPLDLASAGVAISIFNIISKLFNIPLLSVTTSFVAEDISKIYSQKHVYDTFVKTYQEEGKILKNPTERLELPSVSTALLLASCLGVLEASTLFFGSEFFLNLMGLSPTSPMLPLSKMFLALRALGAPAVVISLAVQGVLRGFKDTKTPLLCIGLGNLSSVVLFPLFVHSFHLGISGAALATVTSQYITMILLIWALSKRALLMPPALKDLQFIGYIKSGGFMLGRTLAVLLTMTLSTSMAARQGPLAMAAHQICLQVWLAVSLLSDALAASAQALIASSFAKYDYGKVKEVAYHALKTGAIIGTTLSVILFVSFSNLAELFTKDTEVLQIVRSGLLFVSATQPINALAFVFDGLHYGVSDFSFAAYSMMTSGAISSFVLVYAPRAFGLPGVWLGLTILMSLRMAAGFIRLSWKTGPWWFLQKGADISD